MKPFFQGAFSSCLSAEISSSNGSEPLTSAFPFLVSSQYELWYHERVDNISTASIILFMRYLMELPFDRSHGVGMNLAICFGAKHGQRVATDGKYYSGSLGQSFFFVSKKQFPFFSRRSQFFFSTPSWVGASVFYINLLPFPCLLCGAVGLSFIDARGSSYEKSSKKWNVSLSSPSASFHGDCGRLVELGDRPLSICLL